jgi:hypothetical protein
MQQMENVVAIMVYVIVCIPLAIYVYHQRKNPLVKVMSVDEFGRGLLPGRSDR